MANFKTTYATVNEELAKTANNMNSFSNYRKGSVTGTQQRYVNDLVEYAEKLLAKNPTDDVEKLEKVQEYIDRYSRKLAEALDKDNSIRARVPSILISGGGNFPVRKKEKQNQAAHSHWLQTKHLYEKDDRNYYYKKIRLCLTDSGVIKSDDKDAVEKIKVKIARLEVCPDPYGNSKAEIRRLKERLLQLAPEEVKAGKKITINGVVATFESIVGIFDSIKPEKSQYDLENPSFYLPMVELVFSDGNRKYTKCLSNEVNEDCTEIYSYSKKGFTPFTDYAKFTLVISEIHGSGNKAVIYSILKDLDPRLAEAKAKAESVLAEDKEHSVNGEPVKVQDNKELVRLQVFFDGKPEEATRILLKSNGFKWAPSQGAWQRLSNANAQIALQRILDK